MLRNGCCLLCHCSSRYMETFQFHFERHYASPSLSNKKFLVKSCCGQLMRRFSTTMTITKTIKTPIFAPALMRHPENTSFTTLYHRKHWNIYFFFTKNNNIDDLWLQILCNMMDSYSDIFGCCFEDL